MHRRHSHFHCWRCGFHWTQFCAFYKSWTSYIISLLISADTHLLHQPKSWTKKCEMYSLRCQRVISKTQRSTRSQWIGWVVESSLRIEDAPWIFASSSCHSQVVCCWFDSISEGKGLSARTRQWAKRELKAECILECSSHAFSTYMVRFFSHLNHYCV